MDLLLRFSLWSAAAAVSAAVDLATKDSPHPLVLHHYGHASLLDLLPIGLFLFVSVLYGSHVFALGAGLMFGGLLGNGGELLQHGYATDWIVVGRRVTNIADICLILGLLFAWADLLLRLRRPRKSRSLSWSLNVGALLAASCGVLAAVVSGDIRIGEIVFLLILFEAFLLDRLMKRKSTYA